MGSLGPHAGLSDLDHVLGEVGMAVGDIIISPATVWYAPVATALPDGTSVAYGAAWGGRGCPWARRWAGETEFRQNCWKLMVRQALSAR